MTQVTARYEKVTGRYKKLLQIVHACCRRHARFSPACAMEHASELQPCTVRNMWHYSNGDQGSQRVTEATESQRQG